MISIFNKIEETEKPQFSMPLSLRLIKECSAYGLDWRGIHLVDLLSIVYSIRIDNANRYLKQKRQEELNKRGISDIRKATEEDFDNL